MRREPQTIDSRWCHIRASMEGGIFDWISATMGLYRDGDDRPKRDQKRSCVTQVNDQSLRLSIQQMMCGRRSIQPPRSGQRNRSTQQRLLSGSCLTPLVFAELRGPSRQSTAARRRSRLTFLGAIPRRQTYDVELRNPGFPVPRRPRRPRPASFPDSQVLALASPERDTA